MLDTFNITLKINKCHKINQLIPIHNIPKIPRRQAPLNPIYLYDLIDEVTLKIRQIDRNHEEQLYKINNYQIYGNAFNKHIGIQLYLPNINK